MVTHALTAGALHKWIMKSVFCVGFSVAIQAKRLEEKTLKKILYSG